MGSSFVDVIQPKDHPLFLVTEKGDWIKLLPTLESFQKAYSLSGNNKIWYDGHFYSWSCGFCPRGLSRLLNFFDNSVCEPEDCVKLWDSCIKEFKEKT